MIGREALSRLSREREGGGERGREGERGGERGREGKRGGERVREGERGGERGREGEREGEIYIKTALMFRVTTERIPADSQRPVVIAAFTSILIFIHEVPVLTESYLPLSNSSLTSSPISVNEAHSDTLVKPFFLIHFMA